jgi:hypothetical protein
VSSNQVSLSSPPLFLPLLPFQPFLPTGTHAITFAMENGPFSEDHSAAVHPAFERADVLPCQTCMAIYIVEDPTGAS